MMYPGCSISRYLLGSSDTRKVCRKEGERKKRGREREREKRGREREMEKKREGEREEKEREGVGREGGRRERGREEGEEGEREGEEREEGEMEGGSSDSFKTCLVSADYWYTNTLPQAQQQTGTHDIFNVMLLLSIWTCGNKSTANKPVSYNRYTTHEEDSCILVRLQSHKTLLILIATTFH